MSLQIGPQQFSRQCTGTGTDGAAVMIGKNKGLATRLRVISPRMLTSVCPAHILDLAGNVLDTYPIYTAVSSVLNAASNYFVHSPKRLSGFKNYGKEHNFTVKAIIKPSATRWFVESACLDNMMINHVPMLGWLHTELEQPKCSHDTVSLYNMLVDLNTYLSMHLIKPLLNQLSIAVKNFQAGDLTIGDVPVIVRALKSSIGDAYGEHMLKPVDQIPEGVYDPWDSTRSMLTMAPGALLQEHVCEDGETCFGFDIGGNIISLRYQKKPSSLPITAESRHLKKSSKKQIAAVKELSSSVVDKVSSKFPNDILRTSLNLLHPKTWQRGAPVAKAVFKKTLLDHYCEPAPASGSSSTATPSTFVLSDGSPAPAMLDRTKLSEQLDFFF